MTDTSTRVNFSSENGTKTVIYVSGPMTGLPDFNRPAFNFEAALLRAQGFAVVNPAESTLPEGSAWAAYMREAIVSMMVCNRIHLLPGWQDSKGARLELQIAHALGMTITSAKR